MYNRNDPRFRRTLNQISQNLESANEQAQVGLFSASENYLKPCLSSLSNSLRDCTAACFPTLHNSLRSGGARGVRTRGSRGRAELNFDFYDDWEEDEADALLGLNRDEFDRLLGGNEASSLSQPTEWQRPAAMNYGSHSDNNPSRILPANRARRRSAVLPYDGGPDPTIIPNQSYFGFLSKLPFKIGRRGLRYRPSAEDLQERGNRRGKIAGIDALDDSDGQEEEGTGMRVGGRKRSKTAGSGHTTDSYSSRGDIFPSDEEDAIPLDDEFDEALVRTDTSSGRTKLSRRTRSSQKSTRKSSGTGSDSSKPETDVREDPTMSELQHEERTAQLEEDKEVEQKRDAAQKLAEQRGLISSGESTEQKSEELVSPASSEMASPGETPFPPLDSNAADQDFSTEDRTQPSSGVVSPGNQEHGIPRTRADSID